MTREEAIEILRERDKNMEYVTDNDSEAFKMAIKALEQEPCEDAISRKRVIKYIKEKCNPYGKPSIDFEAGKKAIEYFKALPLVTPKCRCSENSNKSEIPTGSAAKYEAKVLTRGNCMKCGKKLAEGLFFCKECEAGSEKRE